MPLPLHAPGIIMLKEITIIMVMIMVHIFKCLPNLGCCLQVFKKGTVLFNPHNVPHRWILLLFLFYKSSWQLKPRKIYLLRLRNPSTLIHPQMLISTGGQGELLEWA